MGVALGSAEVFTLHLTICFHSTRRRVKGAGAAAVQPLPPTPSPARGGGAGQCWLPLPSQGRGLGGEVSQTSAALPTASKNVGFTASKRSVSSCSVPRA